MKSSCLLFNFSVKTWRKFVHQCKYYLLLYCQSNIHDTIVRFYVYREICENISVIVSYFAFINNELLLLKHFSTLF